MDIFKKLFLILILATLAVGCSSSGKKRFQITGVDSNHVAADWDRQLRILQINPDNTGKGRGIHSSYSPLTRKNWKGNPITCDKNGCWHGIAYPEKIVKLFWPQGRHRWVISHETLHAVDFITGRGDHSNLASPGHPTHFFATDGRRIPAGDLVGGRWPSKIWETIKALRPTGTQPQDIWKNNWSENPDFTCGIEANPDNPAWLKRSARDTAIRDALEKNLKSLKLIN